MKRFSIVIFCFCCLFLATYAGNQNLFNGRNLQGWTFVCKDFITKDSAIFHVKDKIIHAYGKHQAYLISQKAYKVYFELTL
jgi:hypothetical protein